MIYKFYKMKLKKPMKLEPEVEEQFNKLYNENGVEMVGEWIDANDPTQMYFITGYKDEDHYKSFVEKTKTNELYNKFNQRIAELRESIEMVNLLSNRST